MKKTECHRFEADLPDLAEGKEREAAQAHVLQCEECAAKITAYRELLSSFSIPRADAPAQAINAAKGLFTPARPTLLARLALVGAGARAVADADVIHFTRETGEHRVRVMLRQAGLGWDLFGYIDGPAPDRTYCGDVEVDVDQGRFTAHVPDLSEHLLLEFSDCFVSVPLRAED